MHSSLLTPYFSWRSSHRRIHIYANNLVQDHNYVPLQRPQYAASLGVDAGRLEEIAEDTPLFTFLRIVIQQLFSLPCYLFANTTANEGALYKTRSNAFLGNSHLHSSGTLLRPEEATYILLSDLGMLLMGAALWYASTMVGFSTVALLYLQPYLWVNKWVAIITYLHHTYPDIPRYEAAAWTFLKGALATVDREFGWIGKHMFHNITEFQVIHHSFS